MGAASSNIYLVGCLHLFPAIKHALYELCKRMCDTEHTIHIIMFTYKTDSVHKIIHVYILVYDYMHRTWMHTHMHAVHTRMHTHVSDGLTVVYVHKGTSLITHVYVMWMGRTCGGGRNTTGHGWWRSYKMKEQVFRNHRYCQLCFENVCHTYGCSLF